MPKTFISQLKTLNLKRGFSLIEMLVVMTIISILLAAGSYSYTSAQKKGRDGKRKAELKAVQQAFELYYQSNGEYPTGGAGGTIQCEGAAGSIAWGSQFICGTNTYIDKLPKEVKGTTHGEYYYTANSSGGTVIGYVMFAVLENPNDAEYKGGTNYTNPLACDASIPFTPSGGATYNYCVKNP